VKLQNIYKWNVDEKEFKKWLWKIIVGEYQINSQQIKIKWAYKAWVRWYVLYHIKDDNKDMKKILYLILKWIKFVWMWTGTKLGCGNGLVKF